MAVVSFVAAPDGAWFYCVWPLRPESPERAPLAWGQKRGEAQARRAAFAAAKFHCLSAPLEEVPSLAAALLPQLMKWQRARDAGNPHARAPAPQPVRADNECFRVLGLKPKCTRDDVIRAWRRLARATHPDAHGGSDTKFIRAREAYEQALRAVSV